MMPVHPMFADPKTDVIFKRIFGAEEHKSLLIALLNDLLELEGKYRIKSLRYQPLEQEAGAPKRKLSLLDVKCKTGSGRRFVVEMQVYPVDGFRKRVIYNAAKAYVLQLKQGDDFYKLRDVVSVTICNFKLWTKKRPGGGYAVPMLSRWAMQEQHSGEPGLGELQHVFMELPKYDGGDNPTTLVNKWAYFFRETANFEEVPPALSEGPFREALEIARRSSFTDDQWNNYEDAKMAERDDLGRISYARKEGHKAGVVEGKRAALLALLAARGLAPSEEERAKIAACTDDAVLSRWFHAAVLTESVAGTLL